VTQTRGTKTGDAPRAVNPDWHESQMFGGGGRGATSGSGRVYQFLKDCLSVIASACMCVCVCVCVCVCSENRDSFFCLL